MPRAACRRAAAASSALLEAKVRARREAAGAGHVVPENAQDLLPVCFQVLPHGKGWGWQVHDAVSMKRHRSAVCAARQATRCRWSAPVRVER